MWHKVRRLAVLVGILLSILVFVAVLLIQPWERGDEVTGTGIEYRVCNTIVRAVPAHLDVFPLLGYPSRPPAMRIAFKPPIDSGSITDPGAGIEVGVRYGFNVYPQLVAKNCRSSLTLQGKKGDGMDADYSGVQPEDRTAFETFAAEVEYVEDEVVETE